MDGSRGPRLPAPRDARGASSGSGWGATGSDEHAAAANSVPVEPPWPCALAPGRRGRPSCRRLAPGGRRRTRGSSSRGAGGGRGGGREPRPPCGPRTPSTPASPQWQCGDMATMMVLCVATVTELTAVLLISIVRFLSPGQSRGLGWPCCVDLPLLLSRSLAPASSLQTPRGKACVCARARVRTRACSAGPLRVRERQADPRRVARCARNSALVSSRTSSGSPRRRASKSTPLPVRSGFFDLFVILRTCTACGSETFQAIPV